MAEGCQKDLKRGTQVLQLSFLRFLCTSCGRIYPNLLSAPLHLCLGPAAEWPACVICVSRSSHTTSSSSELNDSVPLGFLYLVFCQYYPWGLCHRFIEYSCFTTKLSVLCITLFLLARCKSAEPRWQRKRRKLTRKPNPGGSLLSRVVMRMDASI